MCDGVRQETGMVISSSRDIRQAHESAREYLEQKAAERIALQNEKVYCPPVDVGQLVLLHHRPLGRHKIQDA